MHFYALGFTFLCTFMYFYALFVHFFAFLCNYLHLSFQGGTLFPGENRRRPLHNDAQEAQKHVFPPQNAHFLPGEHMFFAGKKLCGSVVSGAQRFHVSADKTSVVSADKTSVVSADKTSVVSQDIP